MSLQGSWQSSLCRTVLMLTCIKMAGWSWWIGSTALCTCFSASLALQMFSASHLCLCQLVSTASPFHWLSLWKVHRYLCKETTLLPNATTFMNRQITFYLNLNAQTWNHGFTDIFKCVTDKQNLCLLMGVARVHQQVHQNQKKCLALQGSFSFFTCTIVLLWTSTSTLCCCLPCLVELRAHCWRCSRDTTQCWSFSDAVWPSYKAPGSIR